MENTPEANSAVNTRSLTAAAETESPVFQEGESCSNIFVVGSRERTRQGCARGLRRPRRT